MSTTQTSKKTNIVKSASSKQFHYTASGSFDEYNLKVYVNSKKLSYQINSTIHPSHGCFIIYIDAPSTVSTVTVSIGSDSLVYTPQRLDMFETYDRIDNMMDDATSYMFLRANPRITGNVKVVVCPDGNMYMDTFKVSKGLSQQKYRRIPINPNEYYGRTLMAKFKDMPIDDFYKIEDSCYDLFTPANNMDEQYYDKYNCGVRTNGDRLYDENFSILAPLCIRKKLPDFFLVFKVKNYEENLTLDGSVFTAGNPSFLLDYDKCEIVQCFDMREGTGLGTYIRNILENGKTFVGDAYIGEDLDRMNVFHGISVEKGVVTKIYESGHDAQMITNQVAMNDYYTGSFQRNHIVSKDTINFEFMFDDPSEKLFSINHYYGIYVRMNGEPDTFSCVDTSTNGDNVLDTQVGGENFDPSYIKSILYGISTPYKFERLIENVYQSEIIKSYKLRPHTNIAALEITSLKGYTEGQYAFASVRLNDVLDPCEHYRVIDKEDHKIYDVIISNAYDENDISDISYDSSVYGEQEYEIRRVSVLNTKYRKLVDENDKKELIADQVRLIAKAFNSFDTKGKMISFSDEIDSFSIVMKKRLTDNTLQSLIIEKVLSFCGYNMTNVEKMSLLPSDENYIVDNSSDIFGIKGIKRFIVTPTEEELALYYPMGFECMGDRFVQAACFIDIPNILDSGLCPILVDQDVTDKITQYKTVIYPMQYPTDEREYDPLDKTVTVYAISKNNNTHEEIKNIRRCYAVLGFGDKKNYYMMFRNDPSIQLNNRIFLYQNYPMNVGVCSIFQIKDIYSEVLDNHNQYMLSSGTDWEGSPTGNISRSLGEYNTTHNVFSKNITDYTEENFINYIDRLNTYIPSHDYEIVSDDNLGYYLNELIENDHMKMDVAVTTPNCCKWRVAGTDYCGNRLRVMYNLCPNESDDPENLWRPTLIDDIDSYWLTQDVSTHIGFVVRHNPGTMNKYIQCYSSFNNYESFDESLHDGSASLEDLIFYTNNQDCRFSKVYDCGDESLEFVSSGVKIRLKSSDKSKLNLSEYVGYSAILICMNGNNPRRPSTYELFIDENKEQMALFVFNGVSIENIPLEYTYTLTDNFEVKHSTSIYKAIFNTNNTTWDFLDDGALNESLWDFENNMFIDQSYSEYVVFLLSIPHDNGVVEDSYVMVSGTLDRFVKRDDIDGKIYMRLRSVSAYRQGVLTSVDQATNMLNVVDMYVLAHNATDAQESPIRTRTLSLADMKQLTYNYSVFVKKQNGSKEYDESDKILSIRFVDPLKTTREKDTSVYSTQGLTHPSCIEPVMIGILPFSCHDAEVIYVEDSFIKCMNAANILFDQKVGTIDNIHQTWLRKVIDLDATMLDQDTSVGTRRVKVAVYYYVTVQNSDSLPNTGFWYTDSYGSNFLLTGIENGHETPINVYTMPIEPMELLINEIQQYDWSAYYPDNPSTSGHATLNGQMITPSLTYSEGYYSGMLTFNEYAVTNGHVYNHDTYSLVCATFTFYPHSETHSSAFNNLTHNTRFYVYNHHMVKMNNFGGTPNTAPYFDGYPADGIFRLRLNINNANLPYDPNDENTWPFYILPTNISPTSPIAENYLISIDIKEQMVYTPYPDGRSYLIHFTSSSIKTDLYYPHVILVFQGETPDTVMEETNNTICGYKIEDPTMEEVYEDVSVYNTTYMDTTGLTLYRQLNPIVPYWYTNMCRLFNRFDNYVEYYGAFSGYEKNMYLASRAITLKTENNGEITSDITIKTWFNTKTNSSDRTIKLDITESLTELIKTSEGYSETWERLINLFGNSVDMDYTIFKTKYIANTILKFITIDNNIPFKIYTDPSSLEFGFVSDFPEDQQMIEVKNTSNKLTEENGRYYMVIDRLEQKQYAAKMEIKIIDDDVRV